MNIFFVENFNCRVRLIILSIIVLACSKTDSMAQGQVKSKKLEREAEMYYELEEYDVALPMYQKLDSLYPNEGKYMYRIGICLYNSHQRAKSMPYFVKSYELAYHENNKDSVKKSLNFYVARTNHLNHQFDEAIKHYELCKNLGITADTSGLLDLDRFIAMCETGKELVEDSLDLVIDNLGTTINTSYPEYVPVISADETVLIFTSRRPNSTGGKIDQADGMYFEDIYISTRDSAGGWKEPQDMGSHINTEYHDACVGLSPDGRGLFIYRSGKSRKEKGDVFYSTLTEGGTWSVPERLGGHINTFSWEPSATTSSDENTIIFASDRAGGFGGTDLYIVKLQDNGQWTEPQNMGPMINTKYNEDAPFIFSDNKTLFFSSQGHKTMGGYDIFKTTFDEEKKEYSEPVNVGYPINTADDDIYFFWNATGERGYFSSWRNDTHGEKDIYVIHKPVEHKNMIVLKGRVLNEVDQNGIASSLFLIDAETNDTIGVFNSDQADGKYAVRVEHGKKYSVVVQSSGYNYGQEFIEVPDDKTLFALKKDFFVTPLTIGKGIVLNNIFFDFDKATLRKESKHELETLYNFLKNHPELKVEIGGHTDNFGKDQYNLRLSRKRAAAIVKYLVAKGIDKRKLIAKGYGESAPIATNDNPEGRQLNRRTELKLLDSTLNVVNVIKDISIEYISRYNKGADDDNSRDKSLYTAVNATATARDDAWDTGENVKKEPFVYSEDKKPAIGALLKSQVNFLGNETQRLTPFSTQRLMNIVEAMKAYPSMRIAIVTYKDMSIDSDKMAEKRSESIKAMLIKHDIEASRLESRIEEEQDRNPASQLYKVDFSVIGY